MFIRGLFAFALCMGGLSSEAIGAETIKRTSCVAVRFYVARYGESVAEAYARSIGATDSEIEAARRCLPKQPVTTAAVQTGSN